VDDSSTGIAMCQVCGVVAGIIKWSRRQEMADCVEKLQIWVGSSFVPREQELALSSLMQRLA
jgi:hypothetical protein